MSPASSPDQVDTYNDHLSCAQPVISAPLTSQTDSRTDITSPSSSICHSQTGNNTDRSDAACVYGNLEGFQAESMVLPTSFTSDGVYRKKDIVGQYLAQQAAESYNVESHQAPELNYVNKDAGYSVQDASYGILYDSYADEQSSQRWYPDPESIRHNHTLHGLLPHVQPERKLNALSGLQVDIVEGHTGNVLCRAVAKKMLVLFLGRRTVSKFLHTVQREDNEIWKGLPIHQILILPHKVASAASITILVSWMIRACKSATIHTMKQVRIPSNLFAACSLAQTLEMFGLHRDAYRMDTAISQQFLKRPVHAVEVETLWRCLGESNRYVYGCVKAIVSQSLQTRMIEEFDNLAERCPRLYARLHDSALNEEYRPRFGREWFGKLTGRTQERVQTGGFESRAVVGNSVDTRSRKACAGGSQIINLQAQGARFLNPYATEFKPMGTMS
ncbi:hypothetical protein OPT61_g3847 [Boeremia exigua]|uniref:Uncharacterized protein n=1 Tax=Boeremia exigua TaxID=749465 RepID=A0ACC2IGE8_9PLEO|nr:hypothetical protein OPT61_g3847 [Boeremia exigua]